LKYDILSLCAPGREIIMQIKDMPARERPQEKLMFAGPGSLSNAELLALVIRTGTSEKSAVQLAEEVIAYADAAAGGLGKADAKELTCIDGIGVSKACSIVAAVELSKRLIADRVMETAECLTNSGDVADLLMKEMMYEDREFFMALYLNTRMKVESKSIISIGGLDMALVHPREVFAPAVRRGAAAVIVAHNHPSGDPEPSEEDILLTNRLLESSRILGIRLVDHVIIGSGRYVSLRDEGLIPD
jgi:DNA repair protein RadC